MAKVTKRNIKQELSELSLKGSLKRVPKGLVVQRQHTKLNATNVVGRAKTALFDYGASSPISSMVKNKGLVTEAYEWDEEDVSSDDNKMTKVKVLMALADDENVIVGKQSAKNREWVKITMKRVHTLLDMEDNDERKSFLDYLCIDLNYVEE
ncbi:hypothetical protein Tco_1097129 [Tanacetum coccineum]